MKLPYITDNITGMGGALKREPAFFKVTEVPLYEPCGAGQHIYLNISRSLMNTKDVAILLAKLFSLHEVDVGHAGLKDKFAETTQTFSLSLGRNSSLDEVKDKIKTTLPMLTINSIKFHENKIRTGHLIGNEFEIVVTDLSNPDQAYDRAIEVLEALLIKGIPNYYGAQRMGSKGDNPQRGKDVLLGKMKKKHWQAKLLISAYQSYLFNFWLINRIEQGIYDNSIAGDIINRDGIVMGPMVGYKMRMVTDYALELENNILKDEGITIEDFRARKVIGTRRPIKVSLKKCSIDKVSEGLKFSFFLPKGSYATVLMREFIKAEL